MAGPDDADLELSDVRAKLMGALGGGGGGEEKSRETDGTIFDVDDAERRQAAGSTTTNNGTLPKPVSAASAKQPVAQKSQLVVGMWMAINTFATIGIVFTNKAVFSDPALVRMPISFAAFHFTCTSLTLFVVSKFFGAFEPRTLRPVQILPLCFAFCGNVILPNLSLAYSSVTFYQLVRILLTPGTALLNYLFYSTVISRTAALSIIPICAGVAITTYYDALSSTSQRTTSLLGVVFALTGVTVSSLYTIWIGTFAKRYQLSSMQLLYNQAPWSVALLVLCIPFIDILPNYSDVGSTSHYLVLLSGVFAILINISQFFIVHGTSALTSTIVGHVKTCSIVSLGWLFGGRMSNASLLGIAIALSGIFAYSAIQQRERGR